MSNYNDQSSSRRNSTSSRRQSEFGASGARFQKNADLNQYLNDSRFSARNRYAETDSYDRQNKYSEEDAGYTRRSRYAEDDGYTRRSRYAEDESYTRRGRYADEDDGYSRRNRYAEEDDYAAETYEEYEDYDASYDEDGYDDDGYYDDGGYDDASYDDYAEEPVEEARSPRRERRSHIRPAAQQNTPESNRQGLIVLGAMAVLAIAAVIVLIVVLSGGSGDQQEPSVPTAALPTVTITATQAPATQQPTVAPTSAPTQLPMAAPEMEPVSDYTVLPNVPNTDRELGLQEGARVPDSYFDDAVFIGDSVTLKLNYYVRNARKDNPTLLGGAQFLTAGSMGSGNALREVSEDSLHPSYQGQKMLLEDSVAAMGAKKVYIMLGMNDVALYGIDESAENMMKLLKRIKEKSPDVQIFIQSATPRIEGDYNKLNNNALFEYNLKLYEYCMKYKDYGIHFVDIAHVMRDEKGNLPLNYCSDAEGMGLHFTDTACKVWVDYLYTHTLG